MDDTISQLSRGAFSWFKGLRYRSQGEGKGGERKESPKVLNIAVIGLKNCEFDRAAYKTIITQTSSYYEHEINGQSLSVCSDENILEKEMITFLNSAEFDIVIPLGLLPSKGLAKICQMNRPSYAAVFADVHEPIEHNIIDNPLTERSIITGLEEVPVDYMKFITSLTILATRKIKSVLIVTSSHSAQFNPHEMIRLQQAVNAHQIGVKTLVVPSIEFLIRELGSYRDTIDAIIVPRDKMINFYGVTLAKVAQARRILFCVADNETKGAAFNFGMPGGKLGIQASTFAKPLITKSQPLYHVKMQRPLDETVLTICKDILYEQGSFLDRDAVETFDLCPFRIFSE